MPNSRLDRPLWTCPKCGVKLVGKNMSHSCGLATLDQWRARMGPRARVMYDRFVELIAACGEYHVGPAKTRITFLSRVRFAGITSVSEERMVCSFGFPRRLKSRRFDHVYEVVPGWWIHRLEITDPVQLDEEVAGWIAESYRMMGMQGRLRRPAPRRRSARR
jgi:Domain of unknown function (DUF5655)